MERVIETRRSQEVTELSAGQNQQEPSSTREQDPNPLDTGATAAEQARERVEEELQSIDCDFNLVLEANQLVELLESVRRGEIDLDTAVERVALNISLGALEHSEGQPIFSTEYRREPEGLEHILGETLRDLIDPPEERVARLMDEGKYFALPTVVRDQQSVADHALTNDPTTTAVVTFSPGDIYRQGDGAELTGGDIQTNYLQVMLPDPEDSSRVNSYNIEFHGDRDQFEEFAKGVLKLLGYSEEEEFSLETAVIMRGKSVELPFEELPALAREVLADVETEPNVADYLARLEANAPVSEQLTRRTQALSEALEVPIREYLEQALAQQNGEQPALYLGQGLRSYADSLLNGTSTGQQPDTNLGIDQQLENIREFSQQLSTQTGRSMDFSAELSPERLLSDSPLLRLSMKGLQSELQNSSSELGGFIASSVADFIDQKPGSLNAHQVLSLLENGKENIRDRSMQETLAQVSELFRTELERAERALAADGGVIKQLAIQSAEQTMAIQQMTSSIDALLNELREGRQQQIPAEQRQESFSFMGSGVKEEPAQVSARVVNLAEAFDNRQFIEAIEQPGRESGKALLESLKGQPEFAKLNKAIAEVLAEFTGQEVSVKEEREEEELVTNPVRMHTKNEAMLGGAALLIEPEEDEEIQIANTTPEASAQQLKLVEENKLEKKLATETDNEVLNELIEQAQAKGIDVAAIKKGLKGFKTQQEEDLAMIIELVEMLELPVEQRVTILEGARGSLYQLVERIERTLEVTTAVKQSGAEKKLTAA